jgi:hypothetical protein
VTSWRGVVGYEDYYKVSDTGEIWSVRSQRKLATPVNQKRGYMEWTPKVNGSSETLTVHMTVARAFIGESNGRQVRHLNGNNLDNRLENLAYGTPLENQADRKSEGYQGSPRLTLRQEQSIREHSQSGIRTEDLAKAYGVCRNTIDNILAKRQTEVFRELVWRCAQTGAGISIIAAYLKVTHGDISVLLKTHYMSMRKLRKEVRLNKSITVEKLARLIESKN